MLFKLHTYIFIVGFLAIGFIFAMTYERSFILMSVAPIMAFITYMGLLLHFSHERVSDYSERTLFNVVLSYTLLMGIFYMLISVYYDDDTFLFSKVDAMFLLQKQYSGNRIRAYWQFDTPHQQIRI